MPLRDGRTGHLLGFAIANDPDDPDLGEEARDVVAPLSIYRPAGTPLYTNVKARWADTRQDQGPLDHFRPPSFPT